VTGIALRAHPGTMQTVTKFTLEYSVNGASWTQYNNGQLLDGVYEPTYDFYRNDLEPFNAAIVRLRPKEW